MDTSAVAIETTPVVSSVSLQGVLRLALTTLSAARSVGTVIDAAQAGIAVR